jgi:CheY-like chemotaxis protein
MVPPKADAAETGPTVLVIDDDEAVRSSLEMLLETYGFQVVLARNGRQGVAAFRANAPDVVLVDLIMPVQDGLETIALIRREWPKARIVAMSGGAGIGQLGWPRGRPQARRRLRDRKAIRGRRALGHLARSDGRRLSGMG